MEVNAETEVQGLLSDIHGTDAPFEVCEYILVDICPVIDRLVDKSTDCYRAMVLLIAAQVVGTDESTLLMYTDYDKGLIATVRRNLYLAGIWADAGPRYAWRAEQDIFDDALVALGFLERDSNGYRRVDAAKHSEAAKATHPIWLTKYLGKVETRRRNKKCNVTESELGAPAIN